MESMDENDRRAEVAATEEGSATTETAVNDKEELGYDEMVSLYDESMRHLNEGQIVTGHVISVTGNHVIVDVGYKSEGLIPVGEFTDHEGNLNVNQGDEVVLNPTAYVEEARADALNTQEDMPPAEQESSGAAAESGGDSSAKSN